MVTSVTNLGRSGAYDWMVQRVSAVVLALYTAFMVGVLVFTPDLTYEVWSALFAKTWMRIFSLAALVALGAHAWIGLWTITTDYMKNGVIRFVAQAACGTIMFVYFIWGVQILWGL
ncbi:succinate dehydrogenase, hydrophobic membrane anchor protein [Hahella aquimaris]|uniref:Succinate dehydrogenase hydrophobic membrane anchor subunit n=1 Tax=Hahella chejuensis (strain KCTC 2396) TaxID=349521 RepID=Q2SD29_HAHCH|nr:MULTISPECIES: succinate dehydrogenase, hydrophobic membrane anchor protein [Hahella]ABC31445.1 Succinate dehydrogenase, hydrophobic anchor subunit [Hahella chejuensis KCTC 2396]WLQ15088.1 succinate dehydrogenase, hydrophobic membrane anchor protein [Hahella sp. HNIBRBA332]